MVSPIFRIGFIFMVSCIFICCLIFAFACDQKSFAIAFIITFFLFLYSVGVSETDWQYFLQTFYYSLTRRCVTWIGFLLLSFFL